MLRVRELVKLVVECRMKPGHGAHQAVPFVAQAPFVKRHTGCVGRRAAAARAHLKPQCVAAIHREVRRQHIVHSDTAGRLRVAGLRFGQRAVPRVGYRKQPAADGPDRHRPGRRRVAVEIVIVQLFVAQTEVHVQPLRDRHLVVEIEGGRLALVAPDALAPITVRHEPIVGQGADHLTCAIERDHVVDVRLRRHAVDHMSDRRLIIGTPRLEVHHPDGQGVGDLAPGRLPAPAEVAGNIVAGLQLVIEPGLFHQAVAVQGI